MCRVSEGESFLTYNQLQSGTREVIQLALGCSAPLLAHYSLPRFNISDLTLLTRFQIGVGLFALTFRTALKSREAKAVVWAGQIVVVGFGSFSLIRSGDIALPLYSSSLFTLGALLPLLVDFQAREVTLAEGRLREVPHKLPTPDPGWEHWFTLIIEFPEAQRAPYADQMQATLEQKCPLDWERELKILYRYVATQGRGLEWQIDLDNLELKQSIVRDLCPSSYEVDPWFESWAALLGKETGFAEGRKLDRENPIDSQLLKQRAQWLSLFRSRYKSILIPHWVERLNQLKNARLLREVVDYFANLGLKGDKLFEVGYFELDGRIKQRAVAQLLHRAGVIDVDPTGI